MISTHSHNFTRKEAAQYRFMRKRLQMPHSKAMATLLRSRDAKAAVLAREADSPRCKAYPMHENEDDYGRKGFANIKVSMNILGLSFYEPNPVEQYILEKFS